MTYNEAKTLAAGTQIFFVSRMDERGFWSRRLHIVPATIKEIHDNPSLLAVDASVNEFDFRIDSLDIYHTIDEAKAGILSMLEEAEIAEATGGWTRVRINQQTRRETMDAIAGSSRERMAILAKCPPDETKSDVPRPNDDDGDTEEVSKFASVRTTMKSLGNTILKRWTSHRQNEKIS